MWTAITAAVVMGGLIWMARIAAAALRERQRDEDLGELAELVEQSHDAIKLHREEAEGLRAADAHEVHMLAARLTDAETKLATIQSAQAMSGRPARRR